VSQEFSLENGHMSAGVDNSFAVNLRELTYTCTYTSEDRA